MTLANYAVEGITPTGTQQLPTLLLSIDETTVALRSSRTTVFELIKTGQITGIKVGKRRLITMESIERFIARKVAEVAA